MILFHASANIFFLFRIIFLEGIGIFFENAGLQLNLSFGASTSIQIQIFGRDFDFFLKNGIIKYIFG